MKNNKTVLYVVIGILAVALLGGIMDLTKKDETSVSATNILNNTKATSIFANSSTINKIKENVVEKEETNEEKIEQVSKEESKDTEKKTQAILLMKKQLLQKSLNKRIHLKKKQAIHQINLLLLVHLIQIKPITKLLQIQVVLLQSLMVVLRTTKLLRQYGLETQAQNIIDNLVGL